MKRLWEVIRSVCLWIASWLHFLIVVPVLIALAVVLDPRKHDWLQRGLCRRIAFFSGAKVVAQKSPGFDRERTCIFMVNHVNLLDPFMLYCAIPQLVRGWELESHFKIPIYGWLMKRFGNVPVPRRTQPEGPEAAMAADARSHRQRREPDHFSRSEAHARWPCRANLRTADSGWRSNWACPSFLSAWSARFITCARKIGSCGRPLLPYSCTTRSKPSGMRKEDVPALKQRVKQTIEGPVEAWLNASAKSAEPAAPETVVED